MEMTEESGNLQIGQEKSSNLKNKRKTEEKFWGWGAGGVGRDLSDNMKKFSLHIIRILGEDEKGWHRGNIWGNNIS